ncbi:hypothetical protein TNCV_3601491 [Trichonephila clavipes]|nr:hypothetical protein TNCV_3601491 [Trichonephila clavipes]
MSHLSFFAHANVFHQGANLTLSKCPLPAFLRRAKIQKRFASRWTTLTSSRPPKIAGVELCHPQMVGAGGYFDLDPKYNFGVKNGENGQDSYKNCHENSHWDRD